MGEKFYMELYCKLSGKADLLDHLHEIMYTIPIYILISCIPPTSRAFRFHMLRAHLEVNNYKNLEQRLEDFERNVDEQLIPITTDKPPAPSYLLQDKKCSSKNRIEQACYVLDVVALKLGTAYSFENDSVA